MKVINNVRLYSPSKSFKADQRYYVEIREGRITGINEGKLSAGNGHVINGRGRVLMPSFNDSHIHLLRYGLMKDELDLRKADTWEEVVKLTNDDKTKKELKEGDWIVARGLTDNKYNDMVGLATADDLDKIEDQYPMFVLHKDGHECVINNRALEEVQQDDYLELNHDHFIEKGPDGEWTGRFKDTAVHFIKFFFRSKTKQEIKGALRSSFPFLRANGITSIHCDDLNYAGKYEKVWESYRSLEKEEALPIRAYLHHYVFGSDDMYDYLEQSDKRSGDGSKKVRIGAFKIFVDGTHRLHTAALQRPYHDEPETKGILNYTQEELNTMLQTAESSDMQVAMHCIGDRAVDSAIKAIRSAGNTMRHRIIHAQTLSDELLKNIQQLCPCVETQPGFLLDEWNHYAKWVGEYRGPFCGMGQSLIDTGAKITLSSDAPIGPVNPFEHIFAAVNRANHDGHPQGGWIPDERMDIDTALNGYIETPAYLEFMEQEKGIIKQGALADFILLDKHPDDISAKEIHQTKIQQTWLAGKKIFDIEDQK